MDKFIKALKEFREVVEEIRLLVDALGLDYLLLTYGLYLLYKLCIRLTPHIRDGVVTNLENRRRHERAMHRQAEKLKAKLQAEQKPSSDVSRAKARRKP